MQDIRLTDREAMLARTDLPANVFAVTRTDMAGFTARVTVPNPVAPQLPPIEVLHCWISADVTLHGRPVRVVSAHLENVNAAVQQAQARELLDGPLHTEQPSVLLGDLNAPPGSETYALLKNGRGDTWADAHRDDPGFTCGQPPTCVTRTPAAASASTMCSTAAGSPRRRQTESVRTRLTALRRACGPPTMPASGACSTCAEQPLAAPHRPIARQGRRDRERAALWAALRAGGSPASGRFTCVPLRTHLFDIPHTVRRQRSTHATLANRACPGHDPL
ncbi:hypothetical protein HC362_27500 [Streptomyces sp. 891-h]|nr:hypothetical protein HC362_27500 [Streptomyces sp. 891-h]